MRLPVEDQTRGEGEGGGDETACLPGGNGCSLLSVSTLIKNMSACFYFYCCRCLPLAASVFQSGRGGNFQAASVYALRRFCFA